jgi:hypothetical protein
MMLGRAFASSCVAILCLAMPSIAAAQEAAPEKEASHDATPTHGEAPPAAEKAEGEHHGEGAEDKWRASIDTVFGFGATPVVSQRIVGPLLSNESRTAESARYTTTSINLGLAYELMHNFKVGVLLPLGGGSLYPNETRGATVIGNVTVGGEYEVHVKKDVAVGLGVEVALPTASGSELPEAETLKTNHVDQASLDRFSLLRAMSASRGREDTASFSSDHLGIVPKLGVLYTGSEKLELEGYAKYESLHGVRNDAGYEGAIVVAGRAAYHLSKSLDAGVRVWTNIATAGPDSTVAVAEPQITGHVGWITPMLGVVLPFAGEITNPYQIGVRAAAAARF